MLCPHCGFDVGPGNRFCTNCGQSMTAASPTRPSGGWQLVVVEGPRSGTRYPVGDRAQLGRDLETDIVISDERASRRHALIERQGDGYVLSDEGSRNGTFLNGNRLDRPAWLRHGDIVQIGQTRLKAESVPAGPQAQPRPSISPTAPTPPPMTPPGASSRPAPNAPPPPPAYSPPPPPAPSSPSAAAYQAARQAEPVLSVIVGVAHRKGLFSTKDYSLVLTSQRMVFARLTSNMLKEAARQAKADAKAQGKGFFGQWGASMGAHKTLARRYQQMPVDAIMLEHSDNFFVLNQHVRKVTFKKRDAFDESGQPDEMTIHATDKMKFALKGTNASEAKNIVKQVLGSVVK